MGSFSRMNLVKCQYEDRFHREYVKPFQIRIHWLLYNSVFYVTSLVPTRERRSVEVCQLLTDNIVILFGFRTAIC